MKNSQHDELSSCHQMHKTCPITLGQNLDVLSMRHIHIASALNNGRVNFQLSIVDFHNFVSFHGSRDECPQFNGNHQWSLITGT
jgi:hypothetical protein